jgi:hypothetical protein
MPSDPSSLETSQIPGSQIPGSLIPDNLIPADSRLPENEAFFERVAELLDGQPKSPAAAETALTGSDEVLGRIGAELYHVASMLVGEGEEAIELIERVVTDVDLHACADVADARHKSRLLLAADAITMLREQDATGTVFVAPEEESGPASCIENEDLDAAGVSPAELEEMISGPENHRLRTWLEGLTVPLRVIFVLRAIAGLSSGELAGLLAEFGGPVAEAWTPSAVGGVFRQGLCSLASQLIHATATR